MQISMLRFVFIVTVLVKCFLLGARDSETIGSKILLQRWEHLEVIVSKMFYQLSGTETKNEEKGIELLTLNSRKYNF
jgi:hypothetical protein